MSVRPGSCVTRLSLCCSWHSQHGHRALPSPHGALRDPACLRPPVRPSPTHPEATLVCGS